MKRVQEIRSKRERAFWKNRMAGNKTRTLAERARDVQDHIELVQPRTSSSNLEEKIAIKDKIKVRAAKRQVMAAQQMGENKKAKKSRLVPAGAGAQSMGMNVD